MPEVLWSRVEGAGKASKMHVLIDGVFKCYRAGKFARPKPKSKKFSKPFIKSACKECLEAVS